jgi:hypothetical protein
VKDGLNNLKRNKMKQTAVEWLVEGILNYQIKEGVIPQNIIEQAKEMEKEQVTDGYSEGKTNGMDISHPLSLTKEISAEQYYNETFKNKL